MADSNPDLIARLFPAYGNICTLDAIRMRENSGRYLSPQGETEPVNRSRESTVSLEDDEDHASDDTNEYPGLQLSFNRGPKAGQGFMIGTDGNRCDIVLPKLSMISRRHCSLTFDAKRRLILRDFSRHGTTVTYDGKGGEKRHHFPWILSGENAGEVKEIVIKIQTIEFKIQVCKHETHPSLYIDNVNRFLQANADDELTFDALGIQSTSSTAHQSGALTPQTAIYISHERLGSGHFSVVNRAWDVSTGLVYASKEFFNNPKPGWRKEGSIMSKLSEISHEHIVRFVTLKETPSPQLILEYLPLGNLQDQHEKQPFTDHETLVVLDQSLDALTFVHKQNIAHRDIKPENILVQSRDPLHVKLSDFGLSKATADLRTFCGTHLYAAPEIYQPRRDAYYTNAIDIWSLGVVIFRFVYGLPKCYDEHQGVPWCEKIIERLNDWDSDVLVDFLSSAMLILEPERRLSAKECWVQASLLLAPFQSRCLTPTPASYWLDQHQLGCYAEEKEAVEEGIGLAQTSVRPRFLGTISEQSTEIWNPPMQMEAEMPDPTVPRLLRKRLRSSDSINSNMQSSIGGAKKLQVDKSLEENVRGLLAEGTDEHDRQHRVTTSSGCATRTPHIGYDRNTTLKSSGKGLQGVRITVGQPGQKSVKKRARSPFKQFLPANDDIPKATFSTPVGLASYADRSVAKITDFDARHIQMEVNNQVVLMRKEDGFLNATQIMILAQKDDTERKYIVRIIKRHAKVEVLQVKAGSRVSHSWISLQDGEILCKYLNLRHELASLLEYGRMLQGDNYRKATGKGYDYLTEYISKFIEVKVNLNSVMIRRSDFRINATHVLKVAGQRRQEMSNIKKECQGAVFEVVRDCAKYQGTYVDFQVGLKICQKYSLAELKERLRQSWLDEQPLNSHVLEKSYQREPIPQGLALGVQSSDAGLGSQALNQIRKSPGADSYLSEQSRAAFKRKTLSSTNGLISDQLVSAEDQAHVEDEGRIDSFSDTAVSESSVTSLKSSSMQRKARTEVHSPLIHHERESSSRQRSGDVKSFGLDDTEPSPPPARISHYSVWSSTVQYSQLTEVKLDLKAQSCKTSSPYESYVDIY